MTVNGKCVLLWYFVLSLVFISWSRAFHMVVFYKAAFCNAFILLTASRSYWFITFRISDLPRETVYRRDYHSNLIHRRDLHEEPDSPSRPVANQFFVDPCRAINLWRARFFSFLFNLAIPCVYHSVLRLRNWIRPSNTHRSRSPTNRSRRSRCAPNSAPRSGSWSRRRRRRRNLRSKLRSSKDSEVLYDGQHFWFRICI